ncbi:unnamed protein product [Sympodiomycopsis kandeliae]
MSSSSRTASSCLSLLRQQSASSSSRATPSITTARQFSCTPSQSQAPTPRRVIPASHAAVNTQPPSTIIEQAERYPRHPLNAFFPLIEYEVPDLTAGYKKDGTPKQSRKVEGPAALNLEDDIRRSDGRRSWMASELRRKSSVELHQLWYILLIERNRLATSYEELKRTMGRNIASQLVEDRLSAKVRHVRKSMARIKLVLNERRIALTQAQHDARSGVVSAEEDVDQLEGVAAEEAAAIEEEAQAQADAPRENDASVVQKEEPVHINARP